MSATVSFMYIRVVFIVSVVIPWLQLLKLCVCVLLHLSISLTELHCTYELDIQYKSYKLEVFVILVLASL